MRFVETYPAFVLWSFSAFFNSSPVFSALSSSVSFIFQLSFCVPIFFINNRRSNILLKEPLKRLLVLLDKSSKMIAVLASCHGSLYFKLKNYTSEVLFQND